MGVERIVFGGPKTITHEEVKVLYDLVHKYQPVKIVEISTYSGFATIHMAEALRELQGGVIYTFDVKLDVPLEPDVLVNAKNNQLDDIIFSLKANTLEDMLNDVEACVKDADMIYIDGFHTEVGKIVERALKNAERDLVLVMHDVECTPAPEMMNPTVFTALDGEKEVISTQDGAGNRNSFGIAKIAKKKAVVKDVVEVVEEKEEEKPKPKAKRSTKKTSKKASAKKASSE